MDNRYDTADPRPVGLKRTSGDEVNHFIIKDMSKDRGSDKNGIPIKSNWSSMKPLYDDYVLTLERKLELIQLQGQFLENLKKDILSYDGDSLSNITAIHITGTENQVCVHSKKKIMNQVKKLLLILTLTFVLKLG